MEELEEAFFYKMPKHLDFYTDYDRGQKLKQTKRYQHHMSQSLQRKKSIQNHTSQKTGYDEL
jgi:hypothetical protein